MLPGAAAAWQGSHSSPAATGEDAAGVGSRDLRGGSTPQVQRGSRAPGGLPHPLKGKQGQDVGTAALHSSNQTSATGPHRPGGELGGLLQPPIQLRDVATPWQPSRRVTLLRGHLGRVLVTISHPALMAVVISTAVVTLAFTVMTLRFIR